MYFKVVPFLLPMLKVEEEFFFFPLYLLCGPGQTTESKWGSLGDFINNSELYSLSFQQVFNYNSCFSIVSLVPVKVFPCESLLWEAKTPSNACLSLQSWEYQFVLCTSFFHGSKKSCWFFNLFSFLLVVRTQWQLSGTLYAEPAVHLIKCQCHWESFSLKAEEFKLYLETPATQWVLIINISLHVGGLEQVWSAWWEWRMGWGLRESLATVTRLSKQGAGLP